MRERGGRKRKRREEKPMCDVPMLVGTHSHHYHHEKGEEREGHVRKRKERERRIGEKKREKIKREGTACV